MATKPLIAIAKHLKKQLQQLGYEPIRRAGPLTAIHITVSGNEGIWHFKICLHKNNAALFIQKPLYDNGPGDVRPVTTTIGEYKYADPEFPNNLLQDLPKPQ